MSDKQLTPIQKTVAYIDGAIVVNKREADGKDLSYLNIIKSYLQSLLEEEKAFAKDAFEGGIDNFDEFDKCHNYDEDARIAGKKELFDTYYNKYNIS